MKKKVERIEIEGVPVRISVMDRGDVEYDTCWVTFDLVDAVFKETLSDFIVALERAAKSIAEERGFLYLTSYGWDHNCIFTYRCEFSKVNLEEYYND